MDVLISVIVPIYNAEKYLDVCIESILRQTHKNIQLILINDGSTDNSINICNHFKNIDKRVLVFDKQNSGVSASRNLGLRVAEGDYIGFVDSDDFIEENMYQILLDKIIEDKSNLCAMTYYTINEFNLNNKAYSLKPLHSLAALKKFLLLKFPTALWAYLYSKNALRKIYLNEDIHFFEDFEYNFRVLMLAEKVSLCNQKLYYYRPNEASANNQNINDKRVGCLNVYDLIINDLEISNIELAKYAIYFRTHCIISVIASLSKSKNLNIGYFEIAQKESKRMIWKTIYSKYVPTKYKITVLLYAIDPYIFCKILYLLKYKK